MNREGLRNIIILCILCVLVGSASAVTTYTAAKTEICYQNDGPRSWDSMHDDTTSAGVSVDAQYGYISRIRDDANSGQYNSFHRGILKFNTSGMTDGYVQEGAKLYVRDWDVGYAHSGFTTNNIAIVALSDTPAWNTGDFDAFDMSKSYTDGVLHEAGRFDYFDIDSDFPFNTEGDTYIGIVQEMDRTDAAEWASAWTLICLGIYLNDVSDKPYLSFTSESPSYIGNISVSPLCSLNNILFNISVSVDSGTQDFNATLYRNGSFYASYVDWGEANPYYAWYQGLNPGDYQLYADITGSEGYWSGWYNFTVSDCFFRPTVNETYDWRNETNITNFDIPNWTFETNVTRQEIEDLINQSVIPEAVTDAVFDIWDAILSPFTAVLEVITAIANYPITLLTNAFVSIQAGMDYTESVFQSNLGFWVLLFHGFFDIVPDAVELILTGGLVLGAIKIIIGWGWK